MKQSERFNNFDLLRILAALQVLYVHAVEHLGLTQGWWFQAVSLFPGVPIFFVVSGLLVTASLDRADTLRTYFTCRFLRIYPALWVCLGVSILTLIPSNISVDAAEFVPWLLAQISIVQFYNPDFLRNHGVGVLNGSLWTIPVELQFYLALPVVAFLLARLKRPNLALMLAIAGFLVLSRLLLRFMSGQEDIAGKLAGVTVFPWLYLFLLGVWLQRNPAFVERFLAGKAYLWLPLFLVVTAALDALGYDVRGNDLHPLAAILLGLTAVSAAHTAPGLHRVLRGNDLSYGLYIYHMPVINLFIVFGVTGSARAAWLAAIATFALAYASWNLVERPALRLKNRFGSRRDVGLRPLF